MVFQIFLTLFLASFLRLYKIEIFTTFLGEQGRDLLIAKDILIFKKLTLLGPPTSLSPNIHFGPFYHYFNAFWLWIFRLNPIGPAVGFASLAILGCLGLYLIPKIFGFRIAGLISSLAFAVSPLMVEFGRSMFNSYFVVYFTIFYFLFFLVYSKKEEAIFLLISGIFAGLAFQANFLAWGVILSGFILLSRQKDKFKKFLVFFFGVFLATLPYIIFELRHNFFNMRGFLTFVSEKESRDFLLLRFFLGFFDVFWKSFMFSVGNENILLTLIIIFFIFFGFYSILKEKKNSFLKSLLISFFINIFAIGIYQGEKLSHYLGALYPYVFLFLGYFGEKLFLKRTKKLVLIFLGIIFVLNLLKVDLTRNNGYGMPKGWTMIEVKKAGEIIAQDASGSFNVAAILDGDTRAYPYRYIIEAKGKKPDGVEDYPKSETLYVVSHKNEKETFSYPVWEIYSFLPAEIVASWPIKGEISVFKFKKI